MTEVDRLEMVASLKRRFADDYPCINWVTPEEAFRAEAYRGTLIERLADNCSFDCKGTKVDTTFLSPGCRCCASGFWSCLFISAKCNANCFYCPAEQDGCMVPMTQGLEFRDPSEYAEYVRSFGFRGVSISGGEPLMCLDASMAYIRAVRKTLGDDIHIWLYTNGILASPDILRQLRDAGLNEIRFDIGATGYRLEAALSAVGVIDTVTVEIPAVPEDKALLKERIRQMAEGGINHLNLHQLRLTPHNIKKLLPRGYTFIHGNQATVLESELTALELVLETREADITLPINYCSFPFKNRFQRAGLNHRLAQLLVKPHEHITEPGYIRSLKVTGPTEAIASASAAHMGEQRSQSQPSPAPPRTTAMIPASALHYYFGSEMKLTVIYDSPKILSTTTYRHPYVTVPITGSRNLVLERRRVSQHELPLDTAMDFEELCRNPTSAEMLSAYETIPSGLNPYF